MDQATRIEDALIVAQGHCAAARDRALSMTTDDAALAEMLRVRAARRSDDAQWFARRAVSCIAQIVRGGRRQAVVS